ncbi:MAG: c-type cytochrome [Planctomycetota bacterium]
MFRSSATKWKSVVGLAALLVLVGVAAWFSWRRPETTAALRGKEIAQRMGCFACHGPEGSGGVTVIGATGASMPGWDGRTTAMYVKSEQEIREWILYGAPRGDSQANDYSDTKSFVPMPAYEDLLTDRELDDLVAYYLAVSGWAPDIPDAAFEGRKIASRLGCFGCHGPAGMGGVANPGSFKGHIPPWDGEEFKELVRDDEELREWILDGRIRRLWDNPVARRFLESQKTQMPAYREHVSDEEVSKMVRYIRWLRRE